MYFQSKTSLCIVVIMFLVLFSAVNLYSQYSVARVTICTAEVVVGGEVITNMTVTIRNRMTHAVSSSILWTNVGWNTTGWKTANHYADMDFAIPFHKWYVVLSTDNTNSSLANPRFTGDVDSAAGLVDINKTDSKVPMVWQIKSANDLPAPIDPPFPPESGTFTNKGWSWKHMQNKGSSKFLDITANTNTPEGPTDTDLDDVSYYSVPIAIGMNSGVTVTPEFGGNDGALWGTGPFERGDDKNHGNWYFYWAADFSSSLITTYRSTAITFDLVLE